MKNNSQEIGERKNVNPKIAFSDKAKGLDNVTSQKHSDSSPNAEIKQLWRCPKCNGTDRTTYREDPNLKKCWRCGELMHTERVIKIIDDGVRII